MITLTVVVNYVVDYLLYNTEILCVWCTEILCRYPTPPMLDHASQHCGSYGVSSTACKVNYCCSALVDVAGHHMHTPQLGHPTHFLSDVLRAHPTSPRSLVAGPGCINFCLCIFVHHCLGSMAQSYLADSIRCTADVQGRRHLRSFSSTTLIAPSTQRSALGNSTFAVTASQAHRQAGSRATFCSKLKTHFFNLSYNV